MRRFWTTVLVLLCGLWLWLGGKPMPFTVQPFALDLPSSQTIVGRAYLPSTVTTPVPAILLCHGVNSSKDTLAPLAQELTYRGIAGVVFDFGGYGQSYRRPNSLEANLTEATAVLKWMRQQPQFDVQRLGIAGHSMGGTTALEIAKADPSLKTTVLLSIAGFATPTSPANLWFGSGVYEELNPVGSMQEFLTVAAGKTVPPGMVVGDFQQGTARQLVLSPAVDHALAPYDAVLHRAVLDWVEQSFGLTISSQPLQIQRQLWGMVLTVGAGMGLAAIAYRRLLGWQGRWIGMAVGLTGLVGLAMGRSAVVAGWAIAGLVVFIVGNFSDRYAHSDQTLRRCLLYITLLYTLLLLAMVLNALFTGSLIAMPSAITGLPALAKTLVVGLLYDRFHMLRYAVASNPGRVICLTIVAAELISPGIVLHGLGSLARQLLNFMRQPLHWKWQNTSRQTLVLIPGLLGLLAAILFRQQQSGILTWEAGGFALKLIGSFLLVPGMVGVAIVRSPWFQRWEDAWVNQ